MLAILYGRLPEGKRRTMSWLKLSTVVCKPLLILLCFSFVVIVVRVFKMIPGKVLQWVRCCLLHKHEVLSLHPQKQKARHDSMCDCDPSTEGEGEMGNFQGIHGMSV